MKKKAFSEIADDSDGHRIRKGHMIYENFILLTGVGTQSWGIAVGKKDNGYPGADICRSDIIAIPIEKELDEDSQKKLFFSEVNHGEYFRNTLLIGMVAGYLGTTCNSVFEEEANKNLGKMVWNDSVANDSFVTLGGNTIFDKAATYHPEAINQVVENIISILEKR